jgi:hypothetical protein
MPPRKANRGAFVQGNQGYGLRNVAVNAANEPDAGARANERPPVALAHARYHYVNTSIPRFVKIQPGNGVCHGQAAILAVHWQARKAACQTATGTLAASLCAHPSLRARAANSTKTTTLKGRAAMSFHLMSTPAGPFITCVKVQVGMGVPASHWRLYRSLCWHRAFN